MCQKTRFSVKDKFYRLQIFIFFRRKIKFEGFYFLETPSISSFTCKKFIYIWDSERCEFLKIQGLDTGVPTSTLHQMRALSSVEQVMRRGVYGDNEIIIPIKSFLTLVGLEVLNPFYVFQIFSFILWICDDYIYYAMVILFMSSCGIIMAAVQTQKVAYRKFLERKMKSCIYIFFCYIISESRKSAFYGGFLRCGECFEKSMYGCLGKRFG